MKRLYILTLALLSVILGSAQDNWTVKMNKSIVLTGTTKTEQVKTKKLQSAQWKKNGFFEVIYKDKEKEEGWARTIILGDEEGNDIIRKDNVTSLKLDLKFLREKFKTHNKIMVYTFKTPTDPDLAARVRIRRVHLCTLELP
jgi:hypothetical protein